MDKFTNKLGKIESRKYTDKTKNDVYKMIKENISVKTNDEYSNTSIKGIENLTEALYDYIQQEKARQEILTLEQLKLNAVIGTINIKNINEYIQNINEKFNF